MPYTAHLGIVYGQIEKIVTWGMVYDASTRNVNGELSSRPCLAQSSCSQEGCPERCADSKPCIYEDETELWMRLEVIRGLL